MREAYYPCDSVVVVVVVAVDLFPLKGIDSLPYVPGRSLPRPLSMACIVMLEA